jgi:hypothetical protein
MKVVISTNLHDFIYDWTMFMNHAKILIIIISYKGSSKMLTHVMHVYCFEHITTRNCILNHYNIPMYMVVGGKHHQPIHCTQAY